MLHAAQSVQFCKNIIYVTGLITVIVFQFSIEFCMLIKSAEELKREEQGYCWNSDKAF